VSPSHHSTNLKANASDSDWWFASTAIPLIAATFAPLANVLSIAALVVYWRDKVTTPGITADDTAIGIKDPYW
jgi:potassium channel subfamily K, other eukaryote